AQGARRPRRRLDAHPRRARHRAEPGAQGRHAMPVREVLCRASPRIRRFSAVTGATFVTVDLYKARITQSLPFDKTFDTVAPGGRVGFLARHQLHSPSDRQAAVFTWFAFFADLARHRAADRHDVLHVEADQTRPPRACENHLAGTVSQTPAA